MNAAENVQRLRDRLVKQGISEGAANDLALEIVNLWEKVRELEERLQAKR